MDRLIKMLGGEENLPPQISKVEPDPPAVEDTETSPDPGNGDVNNTTTEHEDQLTDDWWNAVPRLPRPNPLQQSNMAPAALAADGSFTFDPRKGEPAPLGIDFSPFAAVTKFCYKFVRKELQQPLATAFFDEGKIWNREWDL